jgi:hypothetical protein
MAQTRSGQHRITRICDGFTEGRRSIFVSALLQIYESQQPVSLLCGRIHGERSAEIFQRSLKLAGVILEPSKAPPD